MPHIITCRAIKTVWEEVTTVKSKVTLSKIVQLDSEEDSYYHKSRIEMKV